MRAKVVVLALLLTTAGASRAGAEETKPAKIELIGGPHWGVDASITPRWIPIGAESGGPETAAAFDLALRFHGLQIGLESAVAKGSLGREDTDALLAVLADVRLTKTVRLVGELRARTELVDVLETDDDFGRPFELRGLAGAAWTRGPVELAAQGGYQSPRGVLSPGPLALVTMTGRW